ncbi:sulfotransferase family 2 domain-containing protein [soil metagenome]
MIISHQHRFVFMKSRKTAGTSVEIALSRVCGPEDVITALPRADEAIRAAAGGRGRQHTTGPGLRRSVHEHSPVAVARQALGEATWAEYFTFVVERNPWDAVVSLYFWVNRHDGRLTFDEFVHRDEVVNLASQQFRSWHARGERAVDRVLRYERLDDEVGEVWEHLGLPGAPELPRAKSGLRDQTGYRQHYVPATRDLVGELFARQIAELGYEF